MSRARSFDWKIAVKLRQKRYFILFKSWHWFKRGGRLTFSRALCGPFFLFFFLFFEALHTILWTRESWLVTPFAIRSTLKGTMCYNVELWFFFYTEPQCSFKSDFFYWSLNLYWIWFNKCCGKFYIDQFVVCVTKYQIYFKMMNSIENEKKIYLIIL